MLSAGARIRCRCGFEWPVHNSKHSRHQEHRQVRKPVCPQPSLSQRRSLRRKDRCCSRSVIFAANPIMDLRIRRRRLILWKRHRVGNRPNWQRCVYLFENSFERNRCVEASRKKEKRSPSTRHCRVHRERDTQAEGVSIWPYLCHARNQPRRTDACWRMLTS